MSNNNEALYRWLQFLNAETKEELEKIAQGDKYLESAFETLKTVSQDEQKRLEYMARKKELEEMNSQEEGETT